MINQVIVRTILTVFFLYIFVVDCLASTIIYLFNGSIFNYIFCLRCLRRSLVFNEVVHALES